jgi:hypothetical protein
MSVKKVAVAAVALVSSLAMLATTQAQSITPSVEVDKAVIMGEQTSTIVLVEVTYTCAASTATTVTVTIKQLSTDSSNGVGDSVGATGSEPVSCTGKPRRLSVSIPNPTAGTGPSFNLGKASVTANLLLATMSIANDTETVGIAFPGGGGEEDH